MKLHIDGDAFKTLIEAVHTETGHRRDVLEKDYYVVLLLQELAEKQRNAFRCNRLVVNLVNMIYHFFWS